MSTYEQAMNSYFLRRRETLTTLREKMKPRIFTVLWAQLQADEALFLRWCTEQVKQEEDHDSMWTEPGVMPQTLGETVDAIDEKIRRATRLIHEIEESRQRLLMLQERLKGDLHAII